MITLLILVIFAACVWESVRYEEARIKRERAERFQRGLDDIWWDFQIERGQALARLGRDRKQAIHLNATLWRIIGDYRAGLVLERTASNAWAWEREHLAHIGVWIANPIQPFRFCAGLDENERVS